MFFQAGNIEINCFVPVRLFSFIWTKKRCFSLVRPAKRWSVSDFLFGFGLDFGKVVDNFPVDFLEA